VVSPLSSGRVPVLKHTEGKDDGGGGRREQGASPLKREGLTGKKDQNLKPFVVISGQGRSGGRPEEYGILKGDCVVLL